MSDRLPMTCDCGAKAFVVLEPIQPNGYQRAQCATCGQTGTLIHVARLARVPYDQQ